jgi:ATP-dependent phosphoenolpyruvate carboxykinase
VAGTEEGVTEPEATFSACFGGAFLMWHPMKYASMLAEKMQAHGATAWLVNTGWTAGRYGVGYRMKLKHTRAIIDAIHSGELLEADYSVTPLFDLHVRLLVMEPSSALSDSGKARMRPRSLGRVLLVKCVAPVDCGPAAPA